MLVVVSAIWYPVAMARYFLNALWRRDDVTVVTAGIDSGTFIPWKGGMQLSDDYTIGTDYTFPLSAIRGRRTLPISAVENQLPADMKPDLWLNIDAGFVWEGKPKYGRTVLIETDPHALDYRDGRRYADDVYCMQTPYMGPGDKYLPYAYDPEYHGLIPPNEPEFDIGMVGVMYDIRRRFLAAFNDKRVYADTGAAYDDVRPIYSRSLTSFNLSTKLDLTARVFELAAMGIPFVANRVPDLEKIFGDSIDAFDTIPDGQRMLRDLLNDEGLRSAAMLRAHHAVQGHTYDARIEQIINGDDYA